MFNLEALRQIRLAEVEAVLPMLPPGARLLEVGAGAGFQAAHLTQKGFDVAAIDMATSEYAGTREFPVQDFDGRTIPFPDGSFDVVFSSNVLEHVPDLAQLNREIARVLRRGGFALHVLPTPAWRSWTTFSAFPDVFAAFGPSPQSAARDLPAAKRALVALFSAFLQKRHGERGNVLTEAWYYRPDWWRRTFVEHGFRVLEDRPLGLFYTGHMVMGAKWGVATRRRLASVLGSACHIYKLAPATDETATSAA